MSLPSPPTPWRKDDEDDEDDEEITVPLPPTSRQADWRRPEDLQDDGPIRRHLEAVRGSCPGNTLTDKIVSDLAALRGAIAAYPYSNSRPGEQLATAYQWVYRQGRNMGGFVPDPVLVVALVVRAGEIKGGLCVDDAFRAYRSRRADYDAVLGGLLPPRFVTLCDERGFERCLNSTASDGVREYARRLAARRATTGAGLKTGFLPFDRSQHGLRGVAVVSGPPEADPSQFVRFLVSSALNENPDLAAVIVPYRTGPDAVMDHFVCMACGATMAEHLGGASLATTNALDRLAKELLGRIAFCRPEPSDEGATAAHVEHALTRSADRLREVSGAERVLFVFDGLDMLDVSPPGGAVEARDDRPDPDVDLDAERISLCRRLSRNYGRDRSPDGSVVLAVVKSRKADPTRRMGAEAVYGSSDLVNLADSVFLIEPDRNGDSHDGMPLALTVAKADAVGALGVIPLTYRPRGLRFDGRGHKREARPGRGPTRTWGDKL